jgi:hypothetical protein
MLKYNVGSINVVHPGTYSKSRPRHSFSISKNILDKSLDGSNIYKITAYFFYCITS